MIAYFWSLFRARFEMLCVATWSDLSCYLFARACRVNDNAMTLRATAYLTVGCSPSYTRARTHIPFTLIFYNCILFLIFQTIISTSYYCMFDSSRNFPCIWKIKFIVALIGKIFAQITFFKFLYFERSKIAWF